MKKVAMKTMVIKNVATLTLAMSVAATLHAAPLKGEDPKQHARMARHWGDVAKQPNLWEGSWQVETGLYAFPGSVDYTPQAAEYVKNAKSAADSPMANCTMPGMPFVMNQGAMPIKFFPGDDMIALYIESYSISRFIHMDGREIDPDPNPTFLGTSVGHWEGDVLVVDTRGFVPQTLLQIGNIPITAPPPGAGPRPTAGSSLAGGPSFLVTDPIFKQHGPNLRFVERIYMPDYRTLHIDTTIYDDTIFAKPYTSTRVWHRHTGRNADPQEWVCSDNRDFYDEKSNALHYNVKDQAVTPNKATP